MISNKESYNKIANQWATERNTSWVSETVIEFASYLAKGGSVLDIGCGSGLPHGKYLIDQGLMYFGLDLSNEMVRLSKANLGEICDIQCCDVFDYIPTFNFNGILAYDSLFHLPLDKQDDIFSLLGSWLKPNGMLLYTYGYDEGEIIGEMMGEKFNYSCLSMEKQQLLLNEAGLEIKWIKKDFVEKDSDRPLVVMARKQ